MQAALLRAPMLKITVARSAILIKVWDARRRPTSANEVRRQRQRNLSDTRRGTRRANAGQPSSSP